MKHVLVLRCKLLALLSASYSSCASACPGATSTTRVTDFARGASSSQALLLFTEKVPAWLEYPGPAPSGGAGPALAGGAKQLDHFRSNSPLINFCLYCYRCSSDIFNKWSGCSILNSCSIGSTSIFNLLAWPTLAQWFGRADLLHKRHLPSFVTQGCPCSVRANSKADLPNAGCS